MFTSNTRDVVRKINENDKNSTKEILDFITQIQIENKNHIIINFVNSDAAQNLKQKWNKKHPNNHCIILTGNKFESVKLNKEVAKKKVKISIIGHCRPGSDYIKYSRHNDHRISYIVLAKKLKLFIRSNKLEDKVIITLIVCSGGRGVYNSPHLYSERSFASKLQYELAKYHIHAPIVARTHIVSIESNKRKVIGSKKTIDINSSFCSYLRKIKNGETINKIIKQAGSKVIFMSNEFGEQIKMDIYYHGWKASVHKTIAKIIRRSRNKNRSTYLKAIQHFCKSESNKAILAKLRQTINEPTPLNSYYVSGISFFRKPDPNNVACKTIKSLVEEKEKIDASPNTIKEITIVRPFCSINR